MNWITRLHGGQVLILGVVMGLIGLTLFHAGYWALDDFDRAVRQRDALRVEVAGIESRLSSAEDERQRRIVEALMGVDLEESREQWRQAEYEVTRARSRMIAWLGAVALLFLVYVGVLWVWFGGRSGRASRPEAYDPPGPP